MTTDILTQIFAQPERFPELSTEDWEAVLGQARQTGLIARLALLFSERGWLTDVPSQPRKYLEGALRLSDRQQREAHWEVDCIRRALDGIDTPIILLKGAAYLLAKLPPGKGRLFSDIDIMVRRESLTEVEGALFRSGWIPEAKDAYDQRYYRQWMHEIPPLKHVRRNTVIDVHHTITAPTSRFAVNPAKIFSTIQSIDRNRNLFVLAPPDMILHSAAHLFQEGEFNHGLRDLLDINDLILHFQGEPEFWKTLFSRSTELGLGLPLYYALINIQRLFSTHVPAEFDSVFRRLQPNPVARKTMSILLRNALRPAHPSCDGPWTGLSRWLLYVRSHYLRMPISLVIPHLIRKAYKRRFAETAT